MPIKSSFVFVILPLSPLSPPTANIVPVGTQLSSCSPAASSSSQVAVTQLVAALANQPYPDRIIRYSYVLYLVVAYVNFFVTNNIHFMVFKWCSVEEKFEVFSLI